jgi:hypothetical protein
MSEECQQPSADPTTRCEPASPDRDCHYWKGARLLVAGLRHWLRSGSNWVQLRRGCNALGAGLLGSWLWSCACDADARWGSHSIVTQGGSTLPCDACRERTRILAGVVEETCRLPVAHSVHMSALSHMSSVKACGATVE